MGLVRLVTFVLAHWLAREGQKVKQGANPFPPWA